MKIKEIMTTDVEIIHPDDTLETAAAERARKLLEISLAEAPDDKLLRAERRRARESGLIALARLNRARRDRLFEALKSDWLGGKAGDFLREVEGLGEAMTDSDLMARSTSPQPLS